jgi:hypothetical protein
MLASSPIPLDIATRLIRVRCALSTAGPQEGAGAGAASRDATRALFQRILDFPLRVIAAEMHLLK